MVDDFLWIVEGMYVPMDFDGHPALLPSPSPPSLFVLAAMNESSSASLNIVAGIPVDLDRPLLPAA